jgi:LuxR family transcriptional regulator, maltose regulon positive regulatory protein
VAWLSLDADDNDPVRFWNYVIATLETLRPGIGEQARMALAVSPPQPLNAILTALTNAFVAGAPEGRPVVLALDDYHVITTPAIHDGLVFLIDHLPPELQLVITSRIDPPLPLTRWRARGELAELRASDLRFTPDETATFLTTIMHLPLEASGVAALEARTEGWVAGLQLAALALRDHTDRGGFIRAFTGSNRFAIEYLAEEVFARQPAHLQRFLLKTAVLDRMCGPLCDELLGMTSQDTEPDNEISGPSDRALGLRAPELPVPPALVEPPSERELEVLLLVAAGLSNQAIAERLVVTLSTVKKHINHLYGKLDVRTRTQAIARARAEPTLGR